jgi:hypothetical protein
MLGTASCAMFFRRKLLQQGFYFDPELKDVGDAVWVEKLLNEKVRIATLPKPLAVFTFTGENRSALPVALTEGASRRPISGLGMRLRRMRMIIAYRIRKALAGAYLPRRVEIEIYTLQSPKERQKRVAKPVGFGWPKT